jgi:hypothetical protein
MAVGSLTLSAAYQGTTAFSASTSNTLTETVTTPTPLSLSSTSLAFGAQIVGTESREQTVTLTNTGGSTLIISSIVLTGQNPTSFLMSNSCPAHLAAGGYCSIQLAYYPQSVGRASASLTITDNASGSPQAVLLTGTGYTRSAVSLEGQSSFRDSAFRHRIGRTDGHPDQHWWKRTCNQQYCTDGRESNVFRGVE